jgi:hypothetical protein
MCSGVLIGAPRRRVSASGSPKLEFQVEVLTRTIPLRFSVLCFGGLAQSLDLAEGDGVIIAGRLEPSSTRDGRAAGVTLLATSVEILETTAPPQQAAAQPLAEVAQ